jgi:signal transduction histidine kinase
MSDVILESVRAIVLLGIVVFLYSAGRNKFKLSRKGWNFIIAGFGLLLMGSLVDITDNFEELNRFVIIGDTPTEAFLEKFVGFLGGFCILAIGLVRWIPSVQKLSDEIAERKQVEKELLKTQLDLQQTLAKEQDLNKLQQQFVSMASHEFRTPLAIIDTAAQRMKRRADENRLTPEEAVQRVDKIRDAVGRMTRLMESTLNMARMEEGKFKVEIKPCDIGKVVREVCER